MIVFVFMVIKVIATLFSIIDPFLTSFSAASVPMVLIWVTDHSSTELFAPKSAFCAVLLLIYFLVWIIAPWMAISNRQVISTAGLAVVIGTNLFDIVCCMLSALSVVEKICNSFFSILVICLSFWLIWDSARFSVLSDET